jgi:peptidoglycan/xylan/chitin deacetylase (PgdA/CDA1 family)
MLAASDRRKSHLMKSLLLTLAHLRKLQPAMDGQGAWASRPCGARRPDARAWAQTGGTPVLPDFNFRRGPLLTLVLFLLVFAGPRLALQAQTQLANANFEEELKGWTLDAPNPAVARVVPEAASLGNKGLRIQSTKDCPSFSLLNSTVPATAGKTYSVEFWSDGGGENPAGTTVDNVTVRLLFKDAGGKELVPAEAKPFLRQKLVAHPYGGPMVRKFQMAAVAPEGAVSQAVQIEVAAGREPNHPVDLDDFLLKELSDVEPPPLTAGQGHPIPPFDPERVKALEQDVASNPYRGKTPPKIVLKLDDLGPAKNGKVPAQWLRVTEYAKAHNIKVSFGIIATGMTREAPEFFQWVKDRNAEGMIEFWNHGWDHGSRPDATTAGKVVQEFNGETYEYQKKHMTDSNQLAREKLGFPFVSFGAPFNATDANTVKVLTEDPDIKVWLFGDAKNPAGKAVLPRDTIGIEYPTLLPSYADFLEAYAHNRGAGLHTMQGHPGGWGDDRWEQFVKVVDFLIAQKAEFLLPKDFAKNPPGPVR